MQTMGHEQRFFSHDGESIAYYTCGAADRPAVFLLHGFRNSARCWFQKGKSYASGLAIDLEEAGYYVIAVDLRGHGNSAKPIQAWKYTNEQELYDIVALADHLGVPRYAVVGYSHGSIEAAKLLTVDQRAICGVLGGIGDKLADKEWKQDYGVRTLAAGLEKEAQASQADVSQRKLALAGVQRGQSVTTPEELATISVPVLCINGRGDKDNGDKKRLSELVPNSELVWVQGDHKTAPMQPEFCTHIVSFISTQWPMCMNPVDAATIGLEHAVASGMQAEQDTTPAPNAPTRRCRWRKKD